MKRSDIRTLVEQELQAIIKEAKIVKKATATDASKLASVFSSLANRAKGKFEKRKVISQVIHSLATSLDVTPSEVLRSYIDYKKSAKGDATPKEQK